MFWRVLGQLLNASRGRLAVALIAIASGAAVTTALINLNLDSERKVSAEFRTLGANAVIVPNTAKNGEYTYSFVIGAVRPPPEVVPKDDRVATPLIRESFLSKLGEIPSDKVGLAVPYLYVIANFAEVEGSQQVILAGTWLDQAPKLAPWWKITGEPVTDRNDLKHCLVGRDVARQLGLAPGSTIELRYSDSSGNRDVAFTVSGIVSSGAQEDNQVIANLAAVQKLSRIDGRVGAIQLSIPGTPREVEKVISQLAYAYQELYFRAVPQIAQAEASLLPRIRGLIFFMVALILVLTTLCVFASMAALAMERRRDVGLMKAIGGSISRIVRIFFTEAAALGLAGALIGYVGGIFLSRWIGQRAFHVAISARPEVLPIVVALMVAVSLAGALPLRLLGRVRPAEILRGE
jgi:putative ABC transport system permease protein